MCSKGRISSKESIVPGKSRCFFHAIAVAEDVVKRSGKLDLVSVAGRYCKEVG